jgi:two-component SAPR family response regulator
MRITCFGRFNFIVPVEAGGLKWGTRRVRELFLYLIDRCGAAATRGELVQAVF